MPKRLSEQQVEQYHRDGFLFPLQALSAGEVARHRAALESYEEHLGGRLSGIGGASRFKNHPASNSGRVISLERTFTWQMAYRDRITTRTSSRFLQTA